MSNPNDEWPDGLLTNFTILLCYVLSWLVPIGFVFLGFLPWIRLFAIDGGSNSDETLFFWGVGAFGLLLLWVRALYQWEGRL